MEEYEARRQLELDRRPLPQKWEAKWVPNAKRFVFINHTTRSTQWNDPRPPVAKPLAGPGDHSMFAESLNRQDPLKDLKQQFPDAPDDVIQQCWRSSGQNKSITASQLKMMGFSDKESSTDSFELRGLTSLSGGDQFSSTSFVSQQAREEEKRKAEEAARKKAAEEARRKAAEEARKRAAEEARKKAAEEAARKKKAEEQRKAAQRIREAAAAKAAADKKAAADRKAAANKKTAAKKTTSPPKPKTLGAAEKKRIEKRLAEQYKDIDAETINMILTTFSHDETRAKMILDGERRRATAEPSGGASAAAAASSAYAASGPRKAFVPPPIPTFDEPDPAPSTTIGVLSAASLLDRSSGFSKPAIEDTDDFFSSLLGDRKKQSVPWSKKGVLSVTATAAKSNAMPKQAMGDPTRTFGTALEIKAAGPNQELTNGADPSLLQREGRLARGRNRRLAHGSQTQLRNGPSARDSGRCSLAHGRASLAMGADADYHVGPNRAPRRALLLEPGSIV